MKEAQSLLQVCSPAHHGTEPVHSDCVVPMQSCYGQSIMLCPGFVPLAEEGFHRFRFIGLKTFRD
jgi:hypothetical protein